MEENTKPIPKENHALIEAQMFGVLTTIRAKDGLLSTNPVSYTWEDQLIKITTLKSRMKYKNIVSDPRVAFCIQSATNIMDYLELRGHATIEDDPDATLVHKQFMHAYGEAPPEDMDPPGAERVIITIHPQQISSPTLYGGRFDDDGNKARNTLD